MGNYNSSQFDNFNDISGGAKKALSNMSLKDMQNKIVQLFSHIGIMNKNTDVKLFLKSIAENTNPALKELNSSKNKEAIENLKDFMVEGLGMEYLKNVKDSMIVLKTGFQLLNSLVHGITFDLSNFRSNLEVNVDGMGKLLVFTEDTISRYKKSLTDEDMPKHKVNKILTILEHLVKMVKTQKDFLSILLNSAKFKDTEMDLEKLASKDYQKEQLSGLRVTDTEISKLIMSLLNDLSKSGALISEVKKIQKLAKDKNLDIPSKSVPDLERLIKNYNSHLKDSNLDNVISWITSLYKIIEEKKRDALKDKKRKGGSDDMDDDMMGEQMLLNKNSAIMSSLIQEYLGSSESGTGNFYLGGVDTLKTTLKYTNMAKSADKTRVFLVLAKNFNKELLKLGEMISNLQKYISNADFKLNEDLERYVKRFLIFQTFRTKSIYLALVGYFSDVQSKFLRDDFLNKVLKLQVLSKEFASTHHQVKETHEIENQLKVIHTSISDLSSKFKDKFGGDDERYRHIDDVSILEIPDLSDVNNKLIKNVVNTLYFIRLKNMTQYIKKFQLYQSKDYDKLVGKAIGEDLDKVREDYKKLLDALNKFEEHVMDPAASEITFDNAVTLNNAIFIYYTAPTVDADGNIVANKVQYKNYQQTSDPGPFIPGGVAASAYAIPPAVAAGAIPGIALPPTPAQLGIQNDFKLIKKVFFQLPQLLSNTQLADEEDNIGLRDQCAWGRKGTATKKWIPFESENSESQRETKKLSGVQLQAAINNYKEFIKMYYESYINLVYAAQAIDQYLKHFSDKIRINPELIEKLELLLENTNIGAVLFDRNKISKLILDVLDPNEYHLPTAGNLAVPTNSTLAGWAPAADGGGAVRPNVMSKKQAYLSILAAKVAVKNAQQDMTEDHFTDIHNFANSLIDNAAVPDANTLLVAVITRIYLHGSEAVAIAGGARGAAAIRAAVAALLAALTGRLRPAGVAIGAAPAAGGPLEALILNNIPAALPALNPPAPGGISALFAIRIYYAIHMVPDNSVDNALRRVPGAHPEYSRANFENNYHYAYSDLKPLIDLIYNRVPSKKNRPALTNRTTLSYVPSDKNSREGYPFMIFSNETRTDPTSNSPINKMLNTKEFYKNNTIIKNILSIFFNLLKDSFNENKEQKYMEPKAILNAITNYLSLGIYKFTYTRPTHGLGKFYNANNPNGVNLNNKADNISLMSLMDNDNLSVFDERYTAMNLLDTNVRVGMVNVNDVDFDNFPEARETIHGKGHNILMHMLKAITAKTLTLLGLYDIRDYKNNKAYRVNLMDPTRVVLGGTGRNYAIKDEYSELYIRLPLIVEFYRMIFYDSMQRPANPDSNDIITMLPELNEPFGGIFRHIFLYFNNKSVVDYNEMEMKEIIADINDIINHFKDKADKDVSFLKFVIYKMIEEVNHKYGVLNRFEYNKYLEKTYEYLNLKHYNVAEVSSFDLLDDDLFDDDGIVNNNIPSDMYSNKPELIDTGMQMYSSFKKFNINGDYQVLKQFRNKVFNLLLETARDDNFIQAYNTQATLFGLDDILSELKLTIKNSKNEQEKFKHIFKLISSTSSFQKIDSMKYLIIYEFIITQNNVIKQILFFLEQLRVRFSNQVTDSNATHIHKVLESTFNGAAGRFIKDKGAGRLNNNPKLLMNPASVRMMGTLPSLSNLSALGLHQYTVASGGAAPALVPDEFGGDFITRPALAVPGVAPGAAALPANPNSGDIIEVMLRRQIDDAFTKDTNFYYIFNKILSSICNIAGPIGIRDGVAAFLNPRYGATAAPAAINSANFINYYIELMEHDVFKLIRKLLLHPNLCEVSSFNSTIKLNLSPLEMKLEAQLNNLVQLFNDVKMNINNNELVAYVNDQLSDSYSRYEYLFKTNISVSNVVNPFETINRTVQTLEDFLNKRITVDHFTTGEQGILFANNTVWRDYYIIIINNLATKFWNTFFISDKKNYTEAPVYKEILNHYRLVNVYGEQINKRNGILSYPLDVHFETRGPRTREQNLDVNNLIYAEPHPEAFSTNGMFDFDIISYFNHILSTFLKGSMSEDTPKLYKLCPEYINYTNDNLDNVIDNTYSNIKTITYYSGGLNYADTLSNAIDFNNPANNVLPNIMNPYLVSHKSLNEKNDEYYNLYDVNLNSTYNNMFLLKHNDAANAIPAPIPANAVPPAKGVQRITNANDIINSSRFMRRFEIYSRTLTYFEPGAPAATSRFNISEPLEKLKRSTLTINNIVQMGAAATNSSNISGVLSIYNSSTSDFNFHELGGLSLHSVTGDFYRNVQIAAALGNQGIFAPPGARTFGAVTALAANIYDRSDYFYPLDLQHLSGLLNFSYTSEFADVGLSKPFYNTNNFIDNNYLGVQLVKLQQEPTNNAVLLKSNALVLRNLLTNYDANKDVKRHLYENLAEIPQKTKDAMLGVCNYTKYHINILQKLIKCLNLVNSFSSSNNEITIRHKNICNNVFSHINALNKQIDIILLELNDEKFNYGETSADNFESIKNLTNNEPNISINSCLYNYLTDFKQYPVYNTCDLPLVTQDSCPRMDTVLENDAIRTQLLFGRNNHILFDNFDPTPAAPNDITTRRTAAGAITHIRYGQLSNANPLMSNYSNLQSGLFAVRKLYSSNKLNINDFSYLKKIITLYNNSVDIKVNESLFSNILSSMVALKFHPEDDPFSLTLSAGYHNVNTCNPSTAGWNDPYINRDIAVTAPAALDVSVNTINRTLLSYAANNNSLLLSIGDENKYTNNQMHEAHPPHRFDINTLSVMINSSDNKNEETTFLVNINKFLHRLYRSQTPFNPFNNKDHLIRMNILDLNIMPIDINAMSREIPLAYLFNYASSFDDFLLDTTEGSIIEREILSMRRNSSNSNQIDTVRSFCTDYFSQYSNASNNDKHIQYLFDRNKRILGQPGLLANNGFRTALETSQIDRILHYNTLLKGVNNIYNSTSAYHLINQFHDFELRSEASGLKDYEHFMENNKYKGCSVNDINAIRLRTRTTPAYSNYRHQPFAPGPPAVGTVPIDAEAYHYYYFDLFSGIHKAPSGVNNNSLGTFQHNLVTVTGALANPPEDPPNSLLNVKLYGNYSNITGPGVAGTAVIAARVPAGEIREPVYAGANPYPAPWWHLMPRNNRVPDASTDKALYPFDNLHGFSALVCGDFVHSITLLQKLDMVDYLNEIFHTNVLEANNRELIKQTADFNIIVNGLMNPVEFDNLPAGTAYSTYRENQQYPHSDLNIGYLRRFKINHIGNLSNDTTSGPIGIGTRGRLNTLSGRAPLMTQLESIYQIFGRFDIRFFPENYFSTNNSNNQKERVARFAHVMSRFLYSDNGYSFTFTRQVGFINLAYNLIRHKIKSESLYNTNKVIQGKLYYQDEYDQYENIMLEPDSLLRKLPRNPLNNSDYATAPNNYMTSLRF